MIRSMHYTESKFSLSSYSESNHSVIQNQLPQPIFRNETYNDESITFISSKFIKSNSVESLPEVPRFKQEEEVDLSKQVPFSMLTCITNTCNRNNSNLIQNNSTYNLITDMSTSPSKKTQTRKLTNLMKKEDIHKFQIAIQQVSEDQIKTMPVLYVNDLRRLAKTINRDFGESYIS